MKFVVTTSLLPLLASPGAAETVLGAYIFHRHGDRTPKSLAPTNLTTLGYEQVYTSGQYYRARYLTGPSKIYGINEDEVKLQQLTVTAPVDNVLQNSAMGFLQALYPPVGQTIQTLANGDNVQAPMDGYQLIPVNTIATGAGSEDAGWLQDATSCYNAKVSSNNYFNSAEYKDISSRTGDFYSSLVPVVNGTLSDDDVTYKNAYIVYDLINVAEIHNTSIPSSSVLTNSTLSQLRTLADTHEWNLAYNSSSTIRAISGMQLAGEILKFFNTTLSTPSTKNKLGVQFGAYATFLSFFGLTNLHEVNVDFTGVPDYASSMSFELFTASDDVGNQFPSEDELQVRFLFHNGTASNESTPSVYPLFGGQNRAVSWKDFRDGLGKFAVSDTRDWCKVCGNSTGSCAAFADDVSSNGEGVSGKGGNGGGMSPAVGGVIGAFVTLGVVLLGVAAAMLLGGLRLVSKKRVAPAGAGGLEGGQGKAQ